jgi:hypothetical protein
MAYSGPAHLFLSPFFLSFLPEPSQLRTVSARHPFALFLFLAAEHERHGARTIILSPNPHLDHLLHLSS